MRYVYYYMFEVCTNANRKMKKVFDERKIYARRIGMKQRTSFKWKFHESLYLSIITNIARK